MTPLKQLKYYATRIRCLTHPLMNSLTHFLVLFLSISIFMNRLFTWRPYLYINNEKKAKRDLKYILGTNLTASFIVTGMKERNDSSGDDDSDDDTDDPSLQSPQSPTEVCPIFLSSFRKYWRVLGMVMDINPLMPGDVISRHEVIALASGDVISCHGFC